MQFAVAKPCHFSINFCPFGLKVYQFLVMWLPSPAKLGEGGHNVGAPLGVAANGGSPGWRPGTFAKERFGSVATYKAWMGVVVKVR